MLALNDAAQGGIAQSETLFILAAVAVAAFWRSLIKIGLAALVLGFLLLFFAGASVALDGIHAILP